MAQTRRPGGKTSQPTRSRGPVSAAAPSGPGRGPGQPEAFGSAAEESGYRSEIAKRQAARGRAKAAEDWLAEYGAAPSSPTSATARAPSSATSATARAPSSASSPRNFATEGAGAMLALFAYPMFVNLLQGGPRQMWGWVRAKWTNAPYGGNGPTAVAGSSTFAPTPSGRAPVPLPVKLGIATG